MEVVFITGAQEHLGKAMAIGLSRAGYKVVATGRDAMQVAALSQRLKGDALAVRCDITSPSECENAVKMAVEKYGRIDVLVNNAGLYEEAAFATVGLERTKAVFDVVVGGTALISTAVVKEMVKQQSGQIINVLDVAIRDGVEKLGSDGSHAVDLAAKNAKRAFAESLQLEAALHNVVVSSFYLKWVASALDIDDPSEPPKGATHPAEAVRLLVEMIENQDIETVVLSSDKK